MSLLLHRHRRLTFGDSLTTQQIDFHRCARSHYASGAAAAPPEPPATVVPFLPPLQLLIITAIRDGDPRKLICICAHFATIFHPVAFLFVALSERNEEREMAKERKKLICSHDLESANSFKLAKLDFHS